MVSDDTQEAAIIDCGCFTEEEWQTVKHYLEQNGLKPTLLLNTHLHFDHALGNRFAVRDYHLKAAASIGDYGIYSKMAEQVTVFLGVAFAKQLGTGFTAQLTPPLNDGDTIRLGNHKLEVIATPGHTPGGLCFYCEEEKVLFAGDSLFMGSIGRTDLPGGNYRSLIEALTGRILTLPAETTVYTGHGPSTTISYESQFNPYL